ncbi:hypothetical protein BDR26DRAFT_852671 [Obelidium mucronatum]|nr:hypothetical protein BDR26DRAFT_852671 [Obelidium mucronatum]
MTKFHNSRNTRTITSDDAKKGKQRSYDPGEFMKSRHNTSDEDSDTNYNDDVEDDIEDDVEDEENDGEDDEEEREYHQKRTIQKQQLPGQQKKKQRIATSSTKKSNPLSLAQRANQTPTNTASVPAAAITPNQPAGLLFSWKRCLTEKQDVLRKSIQKHTLISDAFPEDVPVPSQKDLICEAWTKAAGITVEQFKAQVTRVPDAAIAFQIKTTRLFASRLLRDITILYERLNPYKLSTSIDVAAAEAAALITDDCKYLWKSVRTTASGVVKQSGQFLSDPFLAVAREVATHSAVKKLCPLLELSKHPKFMFFCAAMTRHLLERAATGKTGEFNLTCTSYSTYAENCALLFDSATKSSMEAKSKRFFDALEAQIKEKPVVGKQKNESDLDSGSEQ